MIVAPSKNRQIVLCGVLTVSVYCIFFILWENSSSYAVGDVIEQCSKLGIPSPELMEHFAKLDCDLNPKKDFSFTGAWCPRKENVEIHEEYFDEPLAKQLSKFLKGKSVADFGAGTGKYVEMLQKLGEVASIKGYDGMPDVANISKGLVQRVDLTQDLKDRAPKFDWIISLEVAEHIPSANEDAFLRNIWNHADTGIIISWAVPNQGGKGHVNNRPNEYVKSRMRGAKFSFQHIETEELRNTSRNDYFRNTLMVFRKIKGE